MIKTLWLSIFTDLLLTISLWLHSSEHKVVLFCVFLKEAPITRSLFFTPSFIWTETFSSRSVFCLNLANAEGQHTRKKKDVLSLLHTGGSWTKFRLKHMQSKVGFFSLLILIFMFPLFWCYLNWSKTFELFCLCLKKTAADSLIINTNCTHC